MIRMIKVQISRNFLNKAHEIETLKDFVIRLHFIK